MELRGDFAGSQGGRSLLHSQARVQASPELAFTSTLFTDVSQRPRTMTDTYYVLN